MSDAQQPLGHVARLETRHFSFEAHGTTAADALAAMRTALSRHGVQYNLGGDSWSDVYEDDIKVTAFVPGSASRDGEPLIGAHPGEDDPRAVEAARRRAAFHHSLKTHQIEAAGISWFSLPVALTASDNDHLRYPVEGVLRICEQGTGLGIASAVFHRLNDDGSLGAPVEARNPRFEHDPGIIARTINH